MLGASFQSSPHSDGSDPGVTCGVPKKAEVRKEQRLGRVCPLLWVSGRHSGSASSPECYQKNWAVQSKQDLLCSLGAEVWQGLRLTIRRASGRGQGIGGMPAVLVLGSAPPETSSGASDKSLYFWDLRFSSPTESVKTRGFQGYLLRVSV